MQNVEALRATARKAHEAIGEIEAAERRKTNGPKVGKVFKTRNSYSCPDKPSDYWWLYAKCTRMDEDGFLYAMTFQTDKNGDINIRFDHYSYHLQGYEEIKQGEYKRAWAKLHDKITAA